MGCEKLTHEARTFVLGVSPEMIRIWEELVDEHLTVENALYVSCQWKRLSFEAFAARRGSVILGFCIYIIRFTIVVTTPLVWRISVSRFYPSWDIASLAMKLAAL